MPKSEALRAARRGEIEAMLARYPHLSPEAVAELTQWFATKASSLDIGLIACNDDIAEPYRAFRADHVDPLRGRDWLRGIAFVGVILAIMAVLFWRAF
jgi:hypothetical protein